MIEVGNDSRCWDFPGGPVVKALPSTVGPQVQPLVRELRSCMPQGAAKN